MRVDETFAFTKNGRFELREEEAGGKGGAGALSSKSLAAASADDRRARAARAHDLFRQKFAPRHLFERAGVYSSWGLAVAVDT